MVWYQQRFKMFNCPVKDSAVLQPLASQNPLFDLHANQFLKYFPSHLGFFSPTPFEFAANQGLLKTWSTECGRVNKTLPLHMHTVWEASSTALLFLPVGSSGVESCPPWWEVFTLCWVVGCMWYAWKELNQTWAWSGSCNLRRNTPGAPRFHTWPN